MPEPRLRVLCVDDEPFLVLALARLLRRWFDVETAPDAAAALHAIAMRAPFDAIVTDLSMPGTDGIALLDAVRARAPGMRRILLSGGASARLHAAPPDTWHVHLCKPAPPAAIVAAVIERAPASVSPIRSLPPATTPA